ncbi:MAG TPA: flagellar basal body rod C-terminal domain-containing protein [Xanthomonadaceae bacterium]|jgi:flagellar basal-body rod protein FlgC|nr:flagellar basal body rod C-terminal domain-containing protein [Xanthomonadaceae bacterium]
MSIESVMDATRAGLSYQRLRMDAASRNIAMSNMPLAANASATTTQISGTPSDFGAQIDDNAGFEIEQVPIATREEHDPSHPLADAQGMVHYPATDLVEEMTTLMTASRSYEANVRSFNMLRGMIMKAIEIGAK